MQIERQTLESLIRKWKEIEDQRTINDEMQNRGIRLEADTPSKESLNTRELNILPEMIKLLDQEFSKFFKEYLVYDREKIAKIKEYMKIYKNASVRLKKLKGENPEEKYPVLEEINEILINLLKQTFELQTKKTIIVADKKNEEEMLKMRSILENKKRVVHDKSYRN